MPEAAAETVETILEQVEHDTELVQEFRNTPVWRGWRHMIHLVGAQYDFVADLTLLQNIGAMMPAADIYSIPSPISPPRLITFENWPPGSGKDEKANAQRRYLGGLCLLCESLNTNRPEQLVGSINPIEVTIQELEVSDGENGEDANAQEDRSRRVWLPNPGRLGADFGFNPEAHKFFTDEDWDLNREKFRMATNRYPNNLVQHRLTGLRRGLEYWASGTYSQGLQPSFRIPRSLAGEGTFRRGAFVPCPELGPEDRGRIRRWLDHPTPGMGVFDLTVRNLEAVEQENRELRAFGVRVLQKFGGTPYNPHALEECETDSPRLAERRKLLRTYKATLDKLEATRSPRLTPGEFAAVAPALRWACDWHSAWDDREEDGTVVRLIPGFVFADEAAVLRARLREAWLDSNLTRPRGREFENLYGFDARVWLEVLCAQAAVYYAFANPGSQRPQYNDFLNAYFIPPRCVEQAFRVWRPLMEETFREFLNLEGESSADRPEEVLFLLWYISTHEDPASAHEMLEAAYHQFGLRAEAGGRDERARHAWKRKYWRSGCIDKDLAVSTQEGVVGDALVRLTPDGRRVISAIEPRLVAAWAAPGGASP